MSGTNHDPARINAYLDGDLSPAERADFDALVASDDSLRAELDLQSRIDSRLRVLAAAPNFPGLPTPAPVAHIGPARRALPAWIKIAAVLALACVAAWAVVTKPWSHLLGPAPSLVAVDGVYNRLVRTGFEPAWVCENEEVFREYTRNELGAEFVVTPDPNVQLVGWTYADGLLGDNAKVLLVKHQGRHVIVIMDSKAHDHTVRVEPGSPLKVHRGTVGDVVMYEVTPDATPVVVGHVDAKK